MEDSHVDENNNDQADSNPSGIINFVMFPIIDEYGRGTELGRKGNYPGKRWSRGKQWA
jgi:hypothetical protein